MARRRQAAPRKAATEPAGLPGWLLLLIGLTLGLLVALFVYLDRKLGSDEAASKDSSRRAESQEQEESGSRFDFYTMLPELEVEVPGKDKQGEPSTTPAPQRREQPQAAAEEQTRQSEGRFVLQTGSFKKYREADRMKANLALIGLEASIQKVRVDNATWHRVRIGPYGSRAQARRVGKRLQNHDIDAIVMRDAG